MWTCGRRAEERVLVVECEAFFSGQYAQYLDGKNLRVPDWASLNVLAHGKQDDIRALAIGEPAWRISSDASVWHEAPSFLAQELISQGPGRGAHWQASSNRPSSPSSLSSPGDGDPRWFPPLSSATCAVP